jgi:hypothetical protein
MFERWLEALREVGAERMAMVNHVINELCRRAVAVVLFGSRARGDNTPLSDWDLLAIVPTGEYRVEVVSIGQVVWLPLDKLDDVLETSMIILDAVFDGKILCGDEDVFMMVKRRASGYVEEKGLVRTRAGWFRRDMLNSNP